MNKECPECSDFLHPQAVSCACGWRMAKPKDRPVGVASHALYQHDSGTGYKPPEAVLSRVREVAKPKHQGRFWTPERVCNQQQASFIKQQAGHFGDLSEAGRFFQLCVDRGCISQAGLYLGPAQRMRQPGEDDMEDAA